MLTGKLAHAPPVGFCFKGPWRSIAAIPLFAGTPSLACREGGNWPAPSTAFGQELILKASRLRGSLPSSETGRKDLLGRLLLEVAWTFCGLRRGGRIQTSCRFFLWPVSPPPLGMQTRGGLLEGTWELPIGFGYSPGSADGRFQSISQLFLS